MIDISRIKPICPTHKSAIEIISNGKSNWTCTITTCKTFYIGLNVDLICNIWVKYWGKNEDLLEKFKNEIIFDEEIFYTPYDILNESILKFPTYKEVKKNIEFSIAKLVELEKNAQKQIDDKLNRSKIYSDQIKSLSSSQTCFACGIRPDMSGKCAC